MKQILWFIPILSLLLTACGGNTAQSQESDPADTDTTDLTAAEETPDSTIYGIATEDFGMSTFSLSAEGSGETLYFDRGDAIVSGGLRPGDRYAVTACEGENGPTLLTVINLSEIDRLTKNYKIANGRLVIGGKSITINRLDADSLTGTATDGTQIRIGK